MFTFMNFHCGIIEGLNGSFVCTKSCRPLTSMMLLRRAKSGARGKAAENMVTKPYWITSSRYSSNRASWSHAWKYLISFENIKLNI